MRNEIVPAVPAYGVGRAINPPGTIAPSSLPFLGGLCTETQAGFAQAFRRSGHEGPGPPHGPERSGSP